MKCNCFHDFEYLSAMTEPQKETFQLGMRMTILNLDIRFPCPGFSIDIAQAKQNTHDFTRNLEPTFYKEMKMKCPFEMEVDLFTFPDGFIKRREINPYFIRGGFPEVEGILKEIVENKKTVTEKMRQIKDDEVRRESTITLFDVFTVVVRTRYPFLWDMVLRVLSYIPTSVSCEQSFCILKRRMPENMKKENGFMFVQMAKRQKIIEFGL